MLLDRNLLLLEELGLGLLHGLELLLLLLSLLLLLLRLRHPPAALRCK